jgi:hypothetical protein
VTVRLAERFTGSLLTRDQGKIVREDLRSKIDSGAIVTIEFEGVSELTPSFADEALGRLLLEIGPDRFKSNVILRSATLDVRRLVNKVLAHREKESKDRVQPDPRKRAS